MKKKLLNRKTFVGFLFGICCLAVLLPQSCKKDEQATVINGEAKVPVLETYQYTTGNDATVALGRVLFYDKNLSLNNQLSCGSCHKQQYAFAENKSFSQGLFNGYTSRNSSALLASDRFFSGSRNRFWDGRAGSTDTAVFMPVVNNLEMHIFNLNLLPGKLSKLSYYPTLFTNAYGSPDVTVEGIRTALALFVDNLWSNSSPHDLQQQTALQLEGENLFEGKARCYSCHNGNNFNGYQTTFQNIGLDVNYADIGRGKITMREEDKGKFMVPTLRNIEFSAPYMHDGRYTTLREVIDHYDHGIQNSPNLSYILRDIPESVIDTMNSAPSSDAAFSMYPVIQLGLTEHEKQALEAFLKSLSDPAFITDPKYSDPFR